MRAFNTAWDLLKAPFVPFDDYGEQEPFEGTLYSGGDVSDEPRYWTDDIQTALSYALYGSAIPREGYESLFASPAEPLGHRPSMRETVPTIFTVDSDPDWDQLLQVDPHSGGYISDKEIAERTLDDEEVERLIRERMGMRYGEGADWGTTSRFHDRDAKQEHLQGALERLRSGYSGRLEPDDEAPYRHLLATAESDDISYMADEDPSNLQTYELQRLFMDYIAGEAPSFMTQEHVNELERRLGFLAE